MDLTTGIGFISDIFALRPIVTIAKLDSMLMLMCMCDSKDMRCCCYGRGCKNSGGEDSVDEHYYERIRKGLKR
jgi:hypothetical protein